MIEAAAFCEIRPAAAAAWGSPAAKAANISGEKPS